MSICEDVTINFDPKCVCTLASVSALLTLLLKTKKIRPSTCIVKRQKQIIPKIVYTWEMIDCNICCSVGGSDRSVGGRDRLAPSYFSEVSLWLRKNNYHHFFEDGGSLTVGGFSAFVGYLLTQGNVSKLAA